MPKNPKQPKRVPTGDYPVGFARPPSTHNFPKGKTGNPKGRPRKDPEAPIINPDDLADLVTNPMPMMKNGATKKLSPIGRLRAIPAHCPTMTIRLPDFGRTY